MTDLLLYETGNGGDLIIKDGANDFATVNGYENALYLAMFGGDSSWWGNYIATNPYNSKTANALRTVALNSAGRITIGRAIDADLAFLKNIPDTTYSFTTAITRVNELQIDITVNGKTFSYLWNPDTLFLTYQAA